MTIPDPNFTPNDAQNGYGKHMVSSLPLILFPILVFAFEHEGLRIPITQLTKILNLGTLYLTISILKKALNMKLLLY
jgi:hypothetical protein